MKKHLVNLIKVAISLGIVVYLIVDVQRNNSDLFTRLRDEPKDWSLLGAAWLLIMSAVMLTFVRWYMLVRALDLPFRIRDAFRLGFMGYLLNFISLGAVGGDLFKAVFIAREQPGRRTAAVSTIFVDRLVGLVGLLMLASIPLLFIDVSGMSRDIQRLAQATLIGTVLATAALMTLMFRCGEGPIVDWLGRIPKIGGFFHQIHEATHTYRRRRSVLVLAVVMTLFIHSLNVMAFFCIAAGLPGNAPSVAVHFFIVPIALVSSAIPLPMEALGAFEAVMRYLYDHVGAVEIAGQGLLIALAYRVIRIMVAAVGVGFYLASRREVDEVIHESSGQLSVAGGQCASNTGH